MINHWRPFLILMSLSTARADDRTIPVETGLSTVSVSLRVLPVAECLDVLQPGLRSKSYDRVNADLLSALGEKPSCLDFKVNLNSVLRPKDAPTENSVDEYNRKRILARFDAYSSKHPIDSDLKQFCVDNERDQRRDQDLATALGRGLDPFIASDWALVRKYGWSEGELTAFLTYSESYYQQINGNLRASKGAAQKLPKDLRLVTERLSAGLDKLPSYDSGPVRRFSYLPESELQKHQVGQVVPYHAFTSTSKDPKWTWQNGEGHTFTIYGGPSGKDISIISGRPNEGEVLFKAGTNFKVLSRKSRGFLSSYYDFVMVEVDANGNMLGHPPK